MPHLERLQPKVPWYDVSATPEDWGSTPPDVLGTILTWLHLIRAFEKTALDLASQGLIHGPVHSSIGQEGAAVGSCVALRPLDYINGSHRGHHQFLAKSLGYLADTFDPRADFTAETETLVQRTMSEIAGLAEGFCKGRGGSMHLRWKDAGALGTNAIVGGGVPFAAGTAFAQKLSGSDNVMVTYFGDGAVNIGSVLETMNLSAAWKLPLLFFIENNLYAVATHIEDVTEESRVSSRGQAFGIPAWRVDGMDPLAVKIATELALEVLRAGNGPAIIEADCYRYFHQSGPLPGSAFGYRSKEEEREWQERDPVNLVGRQMVERGLLNAGDVDQLAERARTLMNRCADRLTEPVDTRRKIRDQLWPAPEFRDVGVRGDLSELEGLRFEEESSFSGPLHERKFVDAVADVMHRRMECDDSIIVLGEDIHRLKGGTNGATRGLVEAFPDRVLCTPISENAFVGLAGGLATDGRFKPVVELMYADFTWVAADQIFNQIAKARHMFGGDIDVPLVLRTKVAMGTGYGSQHSMDPTGTYAASSGWRIVAASTPFDYVGLMNSALACSDPVLVLEHVSLYQTKGQIPVDDLDYFIPIGSARVVRPGSALTILTYLSMVHEAVEAANTLGIDAEVVDLRSLDRASLDWQTIGESVKKTNNVIVVEQGSLGHSYGGLLADEIQRRLLDWLDQPVLRVHGGEASPSISKVLERAAIAGQSEIEACLRTAMANRGTPVPD